jgi:hypothetical protein
MCIAHFTDFENRINGRPTYVPRTGGIHHHPVHVGVGIITYKIQK